MPGEPDEPASRSAIGACGILVAPRRTVLRRDPLSTFSSFRGEWAAAAREVVPSLLRSAAPSRAGTSPSWAFWLGSYCVVVSWMLAAARDSNAVSSPTGRFS